MAFIGRTTGGFQEAASAHLVEMVFNGKFSFDSTEIFYRSSNIRHHIRCFVDKHTVHWTSWIDSSI